MFKVLIQHLETHIMIKVPGKVAIVYDTVKMITKKKERSKLFDLNWMQFFEYIRVWMFGFILAFLPVVVTFLKKPIDKLTLYEFFNNHEIIYVCIVLAVLVIGNIKANRMLPPWLIKFNMFFVIIGLVIYLGGEFPILDEGYNLSRFNMCYLITILVIGAISYLSMSYD